MTKKLSKGDSLLIHGHVTHIYKRVPVEVLTELLATYFLFVDADGIYELLNFSSTEVLSTDCSVNDDFTEITWLVAFGSTEETWERKVTIAFNAKEKERAKVRKALYREFATWFLYEEEN